MYTFATKCGIILLLCTISFMVFSKTITVVTPDGKIMICEVYPSGDIICM